MFGIKKRHYICGIRRGHNFALYAMEIVERAFETYTRYTFRCTHCDFTYAVTQYDLTKDEAAIIRRSNPHVK